MESGVEIYINSVRSISPGLSDAELGLFASRITVKDMKKKEFFLQSGKVQRAMGFVVKGLVRSFFIDRNGNEITVGFYAEGDYAAHYASFIAQRPGRYSIQCLEPVTMACLSFEDMKWIYQQSPGFERYGRLVAEEILKRQQTRIESFIFQTAEDRYVDFMSCHSGLYNRVSLSHLCSYLGIERQTLTRIRQRLAR